jgi:glycosyltransferase involved in cell wall biosynthesis
MKALNDAKVAVLYPWTGLPSMNRGAGRRIVPLIILLAGHFREVTVLSPGHEAEQKYGNIRYLFHQPAPIESVLTHFAFWLFDGLTYHSWRGKLSIRERRQWWHYLQPAFQPSLGRAIRDVTRRADIILLDYPFWSWLVHRKIRRNPKPVILSILDLLSDVTSHRWLKNRILTYELEACRKAQAIICDAKFDNERLRAMGFDSEFVPHGFNLSTPVEETRDKFEDPEFERIAAHHRNGGMACFFVGSSLVPNREAVEYIAHMANQLKGEPSILFVVAGACYERTNFGTNMISLGPISESELNQLYSLCDVVLAPITSGTGSSLKVLEALVHRRVLVSTNIGVRSHGLVPEEHAIICDDLSEYPRIILRLAKEPAERRRLSEKGWEFIQDFDYKDVYQAYVRTMTRLLAGSAHSPRGCSTR